MTTFGTLQCSGKDSTNDGTGGGAGETSSGGASSTGGTGMGGSPTGGSAGESSGGANSSGGTSSGGSSGLGGEGGGATCSDSDNCCDPSDPPCEEDWELACYHDWGNPHSCCDAERGIRTTCEYDGDFYTYRDEVCLDCAGHGFGEGACDTCFEEYPVCETGTGPFGPYECDPTGDFVCKNEDAGYLVTCEDGFEVVCTCDPEAVVTH